MKDQMQYEVAESRGAAGEWRVEAINYEGDGEIYITIFAGPDAKIRAHEYAAWKNDAGTVLERALLLACERIADGPQSYEEANTPEDWRDEFIKRAGEVIGR